MTKKKSEGLFVILLAGMVALLAGCVGQQRFTYVMFDGNGCAFFVERLVSGDDAGAVPGQLPAVYKSLTKDWWKGDESYTGTIQRLSHDDLPTCHLPKE